MAMLQMRNIKISGMDRGRENMDRLTETWGQENFVLKGNKTIYNRKPMKRQRVTYALAKLFRYEATGLEPEEITDGKMLTGWIPVAERLPQKKETVLVQTWCGTMHTAWYGLNSEKWKSNDDSGERYQVVAWMPLPKPYEEEN